MNKGGRSRKALWISGLLAILALRPAAAAAESRPAFRPSERDSVAGLRVDYQSEVVEIRKAGAAWALPRLRLLAQTSRVEDALDEIFALNADEAIPKAKQSQDWTDYGLSPEYVWTVDVEFTRGKPRRLLFGRSPGDLSCYWKWADRPDIYRLEKFTWNILAEPEYWMDRSLLPPIDPQRVKIVEAHWVDSTGARAGYTLLRLGADSAVLVEPDTLPLTRNKAWSVFLQANGFAFDGLPLPGEPAAAGAVPQVSVRITLEDGTVYPVETAGFRGDHYYVRHPEGGWVKVLKGRFDAFRRAVSELTALPTYGPWPDDGMPTGPPPGFGVFKPHSHAEDETPEGDPQ